MADLITVRFEAEPFSIEQRIYAYVQSVFPDWSPKDASLAVITSEAFAQEISDLLRLATDVPPEIFMYFGRLVGITPTFAQAATGATTWTMIDDAGYTIPAETTIRFLIGGDEFAYFQTVEDVVVPPGSVATGPGAVLIEALETGSRSSGLATQPELVTILDYVETVAIVGETANGVDEQDTDDFMDKLARRLQLLADRPILPDDFATFVITRFPQVTRVAAIDNYNPADGTYTNEKMIGIAALDTNGDDVVDPLKSEIQTEIEAVREVNFVVNMFNSTRTAITVAVTVMAYAGFDAAAVDAAVVAAVTNYLSPLNFGQPGYSDAPVSWSNETKVRYLEIASVINSVDGVNYIEAGTLLLNGGVADVNLPGAAPLPADNPVVTVTVDLP